MTALEPGGQFAVGTHFQQARVSQTPLQIVRAAPGGPSANTFNTVRFTFDRAVALWSLTADDVKIGGPSGSTIPISVARVVAGTGNRTFDVFFPMQSKPGDYTIRIGPEVMDRAGVKMAVHTTTFRVAPVAPLQVTSALPGGPAANTLGKVKVTFDRAVAPWSFTAADVQITGPGGKVVTVSAVNLVPGTANRTFEVTFPTQTAAGTYSMKIGPEVMDPALVKMAVYSATFRIAPQPRTYTSSVQGAILPRGRAVTLLTVPDDLTIGDLNVRVNVLHPRLSDLYIHLTAPNGLDLVLFNRYGGGSANLVGTTFDDEAPLHAALGWGPYTGSFQPAIPLSNFIGWGAKGMWKLWLEDRGGVNRGTLLNWSLIVRPKGA
jgi:subtilisin-like proprotein convertase family protein